MRRGSNHHNNGHGHPHRGYGNANGGYMPQIPVYQTHPHSPSPNYNHGNHGYGGNANIPLAAQTGYVGYPHTYWSFGVGQNGIPLQGQVALVFIPAGINPSAAVAAGCHIMMLGQCPPQVPDHFDTNLGAFWNLAAMNNLQPPLLHPPPMFQFAFPVPPVVASVGESMNSSGSGYPVNFNPHAEAFIPTSTDVDCQDGATDHLENGSGDNHGSSDDSGASSDGTVGILEKSDDGLGPKLVEIQDLLENLKATY